MEVAPQVGAVGEAGAVLGDEVVEGHLELALLEALVAILERGQCQRRCSLGMRGGWSSCRSSLAQTSRRNLLCQANTIGQLDEVAFALRLEPAVCGGGGSCRRHDGIACEQRM